MSDGSWLIKKLLPWLLFLTFLAVNGLSIYYTIVIGSQRSAIWQLNYLILCLLLFALEMVVLETAVVCIVHVFLPATIQAELEYVQQIVAATSRRQHEAASRSQENRDDKVFNAANSLFLSRHIAKKLKETNRAAAVGRNGLERELVLAYATCLPPLQEDVDSDDKDGIEHKTSYRVRMLIWLASLSSPWQAAVIRAMTLFLLAIILLPCLLLQDHTIALILVPLVLAIGLLGGLGLAGYHLLKQRYRQRSATLQQRQVIEAEFYSQQSRILQQERLLSVEGDNELSAPLTRATLLQLKDVTAFAQNDGSPVKNNAPRRTLHQRTTIARITRSSVQQEVVNKEDDSNEQDKLNNKGEDVASDGDEELDSLVWSDIAEDGEDEEELGNKNSDNDEKPIVDKLVDKLSQDDEEYGEHDYALSIDSSSSAEVEINSTS